MSDRYQVAHDEAGVKSDLRSAAADWVWRMPTFGPMWDATSPIHHLGERGALVGIGGTDHGLQGVEDFVHSDDIVSHFVPV